MKQHLHFDSKEAGDFYNEIKRLSETRPVWVVWSDWVEAVALVLSIASEFRPNVREARSERYKELLAKYTVEDLGGFDRMLDCLVRALEENPRQDFLGKTFEALELSNHWKGQFFTAYHVSELMAQANLSNIEPILEEKEWIDVLDPCSGAGVLLIASRNYLGDIGVGADRVLFVGQDVDMVAGLMGYVQLSLLGCAGYIVVGDSLLDPVVSWNGSHLLPKDDPAYELWFTPAFRSFAWEYRRSKALLMLKRQGDAEKQ